MLLEGVIYVFSCRLCYTWSVAIFHSLFVHLYWKDHFAAFWSPLFEQRCVLLGYPSRALEWLCPHCHLFITSFDSELLYCFLEFFYPHSLFVVDWVQFHQEYLWRLFNSFRKRFYHLRSFEWLDRSKWNCWFRLFVLVGSQVPNGWSSCLPELN